MLSDRLRAQLRTIGFTDPEITAIETRAAQSTDTEKARVVAWEMARAAQEAQIPGLDDDTLDLLADDEINTN